LQDHAYTVFRENTSDFFVAKPSSPPRDTWLEVERLTPDRRKNRLATAALAGRLRKFHPEKEIPAKPAATVATKPAGGVR
jgi:hypothetical protein